MLTLGRWISDRARLSPQRVAIEHAGLSITYAQLEVRARALAGELISRGLAPGDRVATLTENRPEHVVLLFACAMSGLTLAPLNWYLTPTEIAAQLDAFSPSIVLASELHLARLREAVAMSTLQVEVGHLEEPSPSLGTTNLDLPTVTDDMALLLIATSGSTGTPKGALLTHANCFWTNQSLDLSVPITADDVILQVLPQFHVGGWNVQPLLAWMKGATVILESSFDAGRVLELIGTRRVTTMMGVPTNYVMLAQHPNFETADLSSLRTLITGGATMPVTLHAKWRDRGARVVQGYGLTEASPNVCALAAEDAHTHVGSVGKPYAFVDVALYDTDNHSHVEGAGRGELLVRGPNVFAGYWNDPATTAAAFVDGWLRTGDVAERDEEGYYRICGRTKEMYVSGGENVYPAEVERVLTMYEGVIEAAVVARPHPRWGETGVAFVVANAQTALDLDALRTFCRSRLAPYKLPSEIRLVSELPRSSVGKTDRQRLSFIARAEDA